MKKIFLIFAISIFTANAAMASCESDSSFRWWDISQPPQEITDKLNTYMDTPLSSDYNTNMVWQTGTCSGKKLSCSAGTTPNNCEPCTKEMLSDRKKDSLRKDYCSNTSVNSSNTDSTPTESERNTLTAGLRPDVSANDNEDVPKTDTSVSSISAKEQKQIDKQKQDDDKKAAKQAECTDGQEAQKGIFGWTCEDTDATKDLKKSEKLQNKKFWDEVDNAEKEYKETMKQLMEEAKQKV